MLNRRQRVCIHTVPQWRFLRGCSEWIQLQLHTRLFRHEMPIRFGRWTFRFAQLLTAPARSGVQISKSARPPRASTAALALTELIAFRAAAHPPILAHNASCQLAAAIRVATAARARQMPAVSRARVPLASAMLLAQPTLTSAILPLVWT